MQRVNRHRLSVRSRTVTEDDAANLPTIPARLRSKPVKDSDDDSEEDEDESAGTSNKSSRGAKTTSTRRRKNNDTKRLSTSFVYANVGTPFTLSSIASFSFIAEEAAQTSATLPIAEGSGTSMSQGALTGIIAGVTALVMALLLSAGIIWYRRRRRQGRSTEEQARTGPAGDVFGDGVGSAKLSGSRAGRLSKGLGDEDTFSIGEKDAHASTSSLASLSKVEKTSTLDEDKASPAAVRTPILPSSDNSEKIPLTPSHPDYIPERPPRPHHQCLFDSSPVKPIQHNLPNMTPKHASKASDAGMSTYQRNLMALTSSMAFDSPPVLQSTFRPIPRPEDSPFADMHAVKPVTRGLSLTRNMKKDTIVGFAESYGDLYSQSEPVPVQPLYIRSAHNDNARPLGLAIDAGQAGSQPISTNSNKYGISRTPELPPTLELGMPARSLSASMQDLESALEAFDYDARPPALSVDSSSKPTSTAAHTEGTTQSLLPILGNRAPNRALHIPDVPRRDEGKSGARSSYRITRPGAGVGVGTALVSNVMSIHSTAGDIGDMTTLQPKLTASSTSPNISTLASVNAYLAESRSGGIPKSTSSPSLSEKRKSVAHLARKDPRFSGSDESLDRSRRASTLTTTTTNADLETLNGMSEHPFSLEEDARLARAISLNRIDRVEQPNKQRQRASSVSQIQGGRSLRSRTSTAYGGQLPPTPQPDFMHDRRSRTMTTDSEAVFALGSTMLAAFPDTPPSFPSYLRSPDLRVLPPSPSQHSGASTDISTKQESGLMSAARLAEKGFIPLSQMSLQGGKHDKHYRSPIDSIVGVFEYDDARQGDLSSQRR